MNEKITFEEAIRILYSDKEDEPSIEFKESELDERYINLLAECIFNNDPQNTHEMIIKAYEAYKKLNHYINNSSYGNPLYTDKQKYKESQKLINNVPKHFIDFYNEYKQEKEKNYPSSINGQELYDLLKHATDLFEIYENYKNTAFHHYITYSINGDCRIDHIWSTIMNIIEKYTADLIKKDITNYKVIDKNCTNSLNDLFDKIYDQLWKTCGILNEIDKSNIINLHDFNVKNKYDLNKQICNILIEKMPSIPKKYFYIEFGLDNKYEESNDATIATNENNSCNKPKEDDYYYEPDYGIDNYNPTINALFRKFRQF